ncbi:hypothetical protein [Alistipes senegalensis]|uniref:hypothetical protein n=1 Tax=Alistipes senegalensis TaxID=1288121 RepID=UPI0013ED4301|nr:hypothetical protein [Alistipes senegalensis]
MATTTIYLTVRLDLESTMAETISEEETADFIYEMNYTFTAPEGSGITITDTEICGLNE